MDVLVTDGATKRSLLRDRRKCGGDRFDEVWNGVYVMSPLANDEHQRIATSLSFILQTVFEPIGGVDVRAGVNVSDREVDWQGNYRIPDVALRRRDGVSRILETHWVGGPDFVVEIKSRGDRSRRKRGFYAAIGVREMLVIDRRPWAVELYRLADAKLGLVGNSTLDDPQILASEVIPLSFRLIEGPRIEVVHTEGESRWVV